MDLRSFFGEWGVGQPVHVQHEGTQGYLTEVVEFNAEKVVLRSTDEQNPFVFSLESQGDTYSFQLDPGTGITPAFLSGEGLKGMLLPSPPAPIALIIGGEMTLSSNTLIAHVSGRVEFDRSFNLSLQSNITVGTNHAAPQLYTLTGLLKS